MSKWSDEFIGTFENTGKLRRMTQQMKRVNKEETEKIKKLYCKYNLKVLK